MWPFNKSHPKGSLKSVFLDEASYSQHIETLAIDSAARMARGGVALQLGDVVTEDQFAEEMVQLKKKVESTPT